MNKLERMFVEEGSTLVDERPPSRPNNKNCNCNHIVCICAIKILHKEGCRFRRAATCPVGIACDDHNRDVCPICDPCDCSSVEARQQVDRIQNRRRAPT